MQHIGDYHSSSSTEWTQLVDELFPNGLPTRHIWSDQVAILAVLNHLGAASHLHSVFIPTNGRLQLTAAQTNGTSGLTELSIATLPWVAKVKNLSFESFGDQKDYQWCYFRLELDTLPAVPESATGPNDYYQYLTELRPGYYRSPNAWDNRHDEGCELPKGARLVVRYLKGSLVIFKAVSIYASIRYADAGVHATLSADEFRERIALMRSDALRGWQHTSVDRLDQLLLHGTNALDA